MQGYILGIDTSNYKTSVALIDEKETIICDERRFLKVPEHERGLRQQNALFQHIQALPQLVEGVMRPQPDRSRLLAVAVSTRPRPLTGSYMPVFLAGEGCARAIAASCGVPLYRVSHQEGHIRSAAMSCGLMIPERLISFHFSGGTTEAVLIDRSGAQGKADADPVYEIVGGSRDLAFGQVLDRIGVQMGFAFPCGQEIDRLAMEAEAAAEGAGASAGTKKSDALTLSAVPCKEGWINLSGIETECSRKLSDVDPRALAYHLMERLTRAAATMTVDLALKYEVTTFLIAGGVASSSFLRKHFDHELKLVGERRLKKRGRVDLLSKISVSFGSPELSSDNAVGVALLGLDALKQQAEERE